MELKHLPSHQSLIAEISEELVTYAAFLDIPADIDMQDDHVFISGNEEEFSLASLHFRGDSDVEIPTELFCEILMDIKAGMTILEAYNKHGYTFGY